MYSSDVVLQKIHELYRGHDNKARREADGFLQKFQKTQEAAGMSAQLLDHNDEIVQFFAAQTLHRCAKAMSRSEEGNATILQEAKGLLQKIEKINDIRVVVKLASCLAAMLVRVPDADLENFLKSFLHRYTELKHHFIETKQIQTTSNFQIGGSRSSTCGVLDREVHRSLTTEQETQILSEFVSKYGVSQTYVVGFDQNSTANLSLITILATLGALHEEVAIPLRHLDNIPKARMIRENFSFEILSFAALHMGMLANNASTADNGGGKAGGPDKGGKSRLGALDAEKRESESKQTVRKLAVNVLSIYATRTKVGIFTNAVVRESAKPLMKNDPAVLDLVVDGLSSSKEILMLMWHDTKNQNVFDYREGVILKELLLFLKESLPIYCEKIIKKGEAAKSPETTVSNDSAVGAEDSTDILLRSNEDDVTEMVHASVRALWLIVESITQLLFHPDCQGFLLQRISYFFQNMPTLTQELSKMFAQLKEMHREGQLQSEPFRSILAQVTQPCLSGFFQSCVRSHTLLLPYSRGSNQPILVRFPLQSGDSCVAVVNRVNPNLQVNENIKTLQLDIQSVSGVDIEPGDTSLELVRSCAKDTINELFDAWQRVDPNTARNLYNIFRNEIEFAFKHRNLFQLEMLLSLVESFFDSDSVCDSVGDMGLDTDLKKLVELVCNPQLDFPSLAELTLEKCRLVDNSDSHSKFCSDTFKKIVEACIISTTNIMVKFTPLLLEDTVVIEENNTQFGNPQTREADPLVPIMIDFLIRNLKICPGPCSSTLEMILGYFGEYRSIRANFGNLISAVDELVFDVVLREKSSFVTLPDQQTFLAVDQAMYGACCCLVRQNGDNGKMGVADDMISTDEESLSTFMTKFYRLLFASYLVLHILQETQGGDDKGKIMEETKSIVEPFLRTLCNASNPGADDRGDLQSFESYAEHVLGTITNVGRLQDPSVLRFLGLLLLRRLRHIVFLLSEVGVPIKDRNTVAIFTLVGNLLQWENGNVILENDTTQLVLKMPHLINVDNLMGAEDMKGHGRRSSLLNLVCKFASLEVTELYHNENELCEALKDFEQSKIDMYLGNSATALLRVLFANLTEIQGNPVHLKMAGPSRSGKRYIITTQRCLFGLLINFLQSYVPQISHPIVAAQSLQFILRVGSITNVVLEKVFLQVYNEWLLPQIQKIDFSQLNPQLLVPVWDIISDWISQAFPSVNAGGHSRLVSQGIRRSQSAHRVTGDALLPWLELTLKSILYFMTTDDEIRKLCGGSREEVGAKGGAGSTSVNTPNSLAQLRAKMGAQLNDNFTFIYQKFTAVQHVYRSACIALYQIVANYSLFLLQESNQQLFGNLILTTLRTYHNWPSQINSKRVLLFETLKSNTYIQYFDLGLRNYLQNSFDILEGNNDRPTASNDVSLSLHEKVAPNRRELITKCFTQLKERKFHLFLQSSIKSPWDYDFFVIYEEYFP